MDPVVYFEIPVKDIKKSVPFYEKVFGWNFNKFTDDFFLAKTTPVDDKMIVKTPGQINGALMKKDDTIGTERIVILVANIDETLKKAKAAGGKIKQERTESPAAMMYYAVVLDTDGNEIDLMEPFPKK